MADKRDVFFVNNLNFQLFMALLVSQMLGLRKENTYLHINSEVGNGRNAEAIEEHFTLSDEIGKDYGTAYFFTTVYPCYDVFRKLKCEKKVLVYEGLTTYYTEYWASLYKNWAVSDFDEVLVPSVELVENKTAARYVELDCLSWLSNPDHLKTFVETANNIFCYCPQLDKVEKEHKIIFFDRYFEQLTPRIINHTSHRLMTIFCAAAFHNKVLVKLHPFEQQDYYYDRFGFDTIKNKIPNELIYANMLLRENADKDADRVYIIYNSSAAVNCYSIFGDNGFRLVCIGELLNRYGVGVENTLVSYNHTRQVLLKLSRISNIEVLFPKNMEEVFKAAQFKTY